MTYIPCLRRKRNKRLLIFGLILFALVYLIIFLNHSTRVNELFGIVALNSEDGSADYNSPLLLSIEDETENYLPPKHQDQKIVEIELVSKAGEILGNLPSTKFLLGHQFVGWKWKVAKCARFPDLYRLQFSNTFWQVQKIQNATFYLFKAYYDCRPVTELSLTPVVRILVMTDQLKPNFSTFCQFWYLNNSTPITSKVDVQKAIWNESWSKKGIYLGYVLICHVPDSATIPHSVSVVSSECDNATNHLRVINNYRSSEEENVTSGAVEFPVQIKADKPKKFGVCVKGLDLIHEDRSIRLIEWIELLIALGADKIFFYEFAVHPNVKNVLDYYVEQGKVEVTTIKWPGYLPNEPRLRHLFMSHKDHLSDKRKNELIPYNDCLLRNFNDFEYLTMLDTDEVIIPNEHENWNELLTHLELTFNSKGPQTGAKQEPITTYCFRNVYFFDAIPSEEKAKIKTQFGIPSYMHMLQHLYRSSNFTPPKKYVKCFHKTQLTTLVHNHFPLVCFGRRCNVNHVEAELAQLQHYRTTCVKDLKNCKEYENSSVMDTHILKFKDVVIAQVAKVLKHLHWI